jgi:hypothetical protein
MLPFFLLESPASVVRRSPSFGLPLTMMLGKAEKFPAWRIKTAMALAASGVRVALVRRDEERLRGAAVNQLQAMGDRGFGPPISFMLVSDVPVSVNPTQALSLKN